MINSILWNNSANLGKEMFIASSTFPSTIDISYSDVEGGQGSAEVKPGCTLKWGPGMIDADPQFVDETISDLHLTYPSPCKDTGFNAAYLELNDFEGDPRIVHGTADMGADEFCTHLYYTGDATPGGTVEVKFVGMPGMTQVALIIGFSTFDPPLPGAYGDWYIAPPMIIIPGLGPLPPSGVFALPGTLPASVPGPYTVYFQVMIDYQLTNLCVMTVK